MSLGPQEERNITLKTNVHRNSKFPQLMHIRNLRQPSYYADYRKQHSLGLWHDSTDQNRLNWVREWRVCGCSVHSREAKGRNKTPQTDSRPVDAKARWLSRRDVQTRTRIWDANCRLNATRPWAQRWGFKAWLNSAPTQRTSARTTSFRVWKPNRTSGRGD